MQKTIRISGRFAHYRYLKADFNRIRIKQAGIDRDNDLIVRLEFIAKGEKKPFEYYYMFYNEQEAFIGVLYRYLVSSATYGLDDKGLFLFWLTELNENPDQIALYIFDKCGQQTFDLNISKMDVKAFYEAFCEVVETET